MKKTISINISGAIFHIEEDGYDKLRAYLGSVQQYFSAYEDSQEIITDIENRIAEKLANRLKATGSQAVTLEDVTDLIGTMGTVADFEANDDEDVLGADSLPHRTDVAGQSAVAQSESSLGASPTANPTATTSAPTDNGPADRSSTDRGSAIPRARRLVRDLRRRTVGGVASGLAHFFDVDPVWVRLAFVALVVLFPALAGSKGNHNNGFGQLAGLTVLVYIALWIALPGVSDIEDNKTLRKFYRNPSDKVLGGVASGLAAYFGIEVGLVRLLFVLTIPIVGLGLLVYITLWLIAPMANSLTEKMEMQGRPITLSNIEDSIRTSLNNTVNAPETSISRALLLPFRAIAVVMEALGRSLGPILGGLGTVARVFAGIIVLIIALSLFLAWVVLFGALAGLLAGTSFGPDGASSPYWVQVLHNEANGWLLVSGAVFFGIIWFWLLLTGLWLLTKRTLISGRTVLTVTGVQILALVLLIATSTAVAGNFRRDGSVEVSQTLTPTGTPTFDMHDIDTDYDQQPSLQVEGYSGKAIVLEQRFEAKGRNRVDAEANARRIRYSLTKRDSLIRFDDAIDLLPNARFRGQELHMVLRIPYNQPFRMTKSFGWFVGGSFGDENELTDAEHDRGAEALWVLNPTGELICVNFPRIPRVDQEDKTDAEAAQIEADSATFLIPIPPLAPGSLTRSLPVESFKSIIVSGRFSVIVQPGKTGLSGAGDAADLDRIAVSSKNGMLMVSVPDGQTEWAGDPVVLTITMPMVEKITLDGSSALRLSGFTDIATLALTLSGTSTADMAATIGRLTLNETGESRANLYGRATDVNALLKGKSTLNAKQIQIETATVRAEDNSRVITGAIKSLRSSTDGKARIN